MRYVNCSRHWEEQNLIAYQYQGQIYYRTIKIIPKFTELLVFYGGEFAQMLGVNLKLYNQTLPPPLKHSGVAVLQNNSNDKTQDNASGFKENVAKSENKDTPKIYPKFTNVNKGKRKTKSKIKEKKCESVAKIQSKNNLKSTNLQYQKTQASLTENEIKDNQKTKQDLIERDIETYQNNNVEKTTDIKLSDLSLTYDSLNTCQINSDAIIQNQENRLTLSSQNIKQFQTINIESKSEQTSGSAELDTQHFKNKTVVASTVSDQNNFVCSVCNKNFGEKNSLTEHLNSHNESSTSHPCIICKKRFNCKCNQRLNGYAGYNTRSYLCDVM
ncbi:hypothetical protein ACJJTC_009372 [Scirpophaga incertulas]